MQCGHKAFATPVYSTGAGMDQIPLARTKEVASGYRRRRDMLMWAMERRAMESTWWQHELCPRRIETLNSRRSPDRIAVRVAAKTSSRWDDFAPARTHARGPFCCPPGAIGGSRSNATPTRAGRGHPNSKGTHPPPVG